ncbi:hypothetical protein, partial [Burkholderia ubonensis]|uniref:hypothetical protein n=1 Tax=Burkholderia ubonensis TaxID=101571 RepID=UPI001E640774
MPAAVQEAGSAAWPSRASDARRRNAAGNTRSPDFENSFAGLAARRANRRVMLLANTLGIRFVAILA